MRILFRIVANAIALYATSFVPGIHWSGDVLHLLLAGALLGIFNLTVRPVALLLSIPFLILSLGLFYFVLNGILLWVASFFLPHYSVSGIVSGMLGALVMTVVNWALGTLLSDTRRS